MPEQKPSVGRVVHYVRLDAECLAAMVTETYGDSDAVGLAVFGSTGIWFDRTVLHDETGKSIRSWHWPERT
jgi:hypothetical protein